MQKKIKLAVLLGFLFLVLGIWISRYYLICYGGFWILDHTTAGPMIEDINMEIREVGNHVIPLLEKTYKDTKLSQKRRGAAAWAMMKVDQARAENLFLPYLLKGNKDEIIAQAIFDLGRNGSKNAYNAVLPYLKSPNDNIRWAVVFYLGEVNMPESVILLQQIKETDQSEEIRIAAVHRLQILGVLPIPYKVHEGKRSTKANE